MSPLDGPALPRPKSASTARGARRYRRHVASPKQWAALQEAKRGPCRVCADPASNGELHSHIHLHHVVGRDHDGDDFADNLVPVCPRHHELLHVREPVTCRALLDSLTPAERAYMVKRGGANYAERAYGVRRP